jgi:hypothetical protein
MSRRSVNLYRQLLNLYPPSFRAEFAGEMEAVFAQALAQAASRGWLAVLAFGWRELRDLPMSVLVEHWHALKSQEINMDGRSTHHTRGGWWAALVAGLPHLLYALVWYGPLWFYDVSTYGLTMLADPGGSYPRFDLAPMTFLRPGFWLLTAVLCAIGLLRGAPRWSASWAGYGLLGLLDRVVNVDPDLSLVSAALLLSWLALAAGAIFWLGRRDPLTGLLAILPLAPMAFWSLEMDVVISNLEGFVYMPAGLLMGMTAAFAVRVGSFRAALCASLAVIALAGLPIHYGAAYYPSPTFPAPASPAAVVQGSIGDLVGLALVGAPLWLWLFWHRRRRGPAQA